MLHAILLTQKHSRVQTSDNAEDIFVSITRFSLHCLLGRWVV